MYFEICQKLDEGGRFPGLTALQRGRTCDAVCASSQSVMAHGQHAAHRTSGTCTVQTVVYQFMHNICIYVLLADTKQACYRQDWLQVNRE